MFSKKKGIDSIFIILGMRCDRLDQMLEFFFNFGESFSILLIAHIINSNGPTFKSRKLKSIVFIFHIFRFLFNIPVFLNVIGK